jgi:hypothetical protein
MKNKTQFVVMSHWILDEVKQTYCPTYGNQKFAISSKGGDNLSSNEKLVNHV